MSVQRFDKGSLRPAKKMPDGRLRVDAYITKTGVFVYSNPDGTVRRELRHPEDVFDQESLDSFAQLPVTNTHPREMLTAKTAKRHMVGSTGEQIARDGDHVRASIVVMDADTIAEMEKGTKVEVSNGYVCDLEEGPGVDPTFGPWDFRQRNIRGNHVALVERGRAGATARVRMDGEHLDMDTDTKHAMISNMPDNTDSLAVLNTQVKDAEDKASKLDADLKVANARADEASAALKIAEKKIADQAAQLAANNAIVDSENTKREKERADAAEAEIRAFDQKFDAAVRARVALERTAAMFLGDTRMDDLSDRQVRCETIKRLDSTVDVGDNVNDSEIIGIFKMVTANRVAEVRRVAEVSEQLASGAVKAEHKDTKAPFNPADLFNEPLPSTVKYKR